MTLVRMVMAPTARSPPYFSREELKHTKMTLSLACMTKEDDPSAMQGGTRCRPDSRFSRRRRSSVFLPQRNDVTQTQDRA